MASRGRGKRVSKTETKSRLGSIVREQKAQTQEKNPKRKHILSEEEEDEMVMNGGDGWIRRSKRIGEQRSKKVKQRATELRSQGKGHLLIPRNANIVQLSSDSSTPNTSEELIDIDSTTDPSPTESEGTNDSVTSYESGILEEIMAEHQAPMEVYYSDDEEDRMVHDAEKQLYNEMVGYEADGEQVTCQPQPLAMDDSSVDRRSSQWGQAEKKAQEGQSSVNLSQKMDDESNIRGQEKGDDYSGAQCVVAASTIQSAMPPRQVNMYPANRKVMTMGEAESVIKKKYGQDATNVGDEGGFAPNIQLLQTLSVQDMTSPGGGSGIGGDGESSSGVS
ncbi:hypothetical protein IFM89_010631 [Coptis chinensis]|uniref:phosphopyruvate hydratase n=1 Tax=Coptis chinensis TaxID=261450 RepID=A0A835IJB9_9MAGN|nr:hypothetical protein IFM89_010631 [Coptis chinensis]